MPDDFVWIVRSLDMIFLAVGFTLNWSVASSLEISRAVRKFLLKLWVCNSLLVHELIATCKFSKERLPDNAPDQIQFMIKPISWFLWATLKGFPCSLHRVVGYAWMTWISSLADATFFFSNRLHVIGLHFWLSFLWRHWNILYTWQWICVRQLDNTKCSPTSCSHFLICTFGRLKGNYFPTMTEIYLSKFIS